MEPQQHRSTSVGESVSLDTDRDCDPDRDTGIADYFSRRRVLLAVGGGTVGALAGCVGILRTTRREDKWTAIRRSSRRRCPSHRFVGVVPGTLTTSKTPQDDR